MLILAIDPGATQSGWCLYDPRLVKAPIHFSGVVPNAQVAAYLEGRSDYPWGHCIIEWIAHYGRGMPAGASVFDTCRWVGRFEQAWKHDAACTLMMCRDVKLHLCGSVKAKDSNIRQALIDKFGGKDKAIGKKANPGPLHGVKSHAWSALALAVTWHEQNERTNDD